MKNDRQKMILEMENRILDQICLNIVMKELRKRMNY